MRKSPGRFTLPLVDKKKKYEELETEMPPEKRSIIIDFLNVFLDKNLILWKQLRPYLTDVTKEESYEAIRGTKLGYSLLNFGMVGENILKNLKKGGVEKLDPQVIQNELEKYGFGNKLATVITSIIVGGILTGITYNKLDKTNKSKKSKIGARAEHNKAKLKEISKLRKKYNLS